MNGSQQKKPVKLSSRQIAVLVAIFIGLVAYQFLRPTLEQRLGIPLPDLWQQITQSQNEQREANPPSADAEPAPQERPTTSADRSPPIKPQASQPRTSEPRDHSGFPPAQWGRSPLTSPAGLVYRMGPGGEHRLDHVLRHAEDDPDRPVHSVFNGNRTEIFAAIDEAFVVAKKGRGRVEQSRQDGRDVWIVDMQRVVGFEGGRDGKRKGFPELRRIRLVLEDQQAVITAYPCR